MEKQSKRKLNLQEATKYFFLSFFAISMLTSNGLVVSKSPWKCPKQGSLARQF